MQRTLALCSVLTIVTLVVLAALPAQADSSDFFMSTWQVDLETSFGAEARICLEFRDPESFFFGSVAAGLSIPNGFTRSAIGLSQVMVGSVANDTLSGFAVEFPDNADGWESVLSLSLRQRGPNRAIGSFTLGGIGSAGGGGKSFERWGSAVARKVDDFACVPRGWSN